MSMQGMGGCCQLYELYGFGTEPVSGELKITLDAEIYKWRRYNIVATTSPRQIKVYEYLISQGFRPMTEFPSHYGYYDILWMRLSDDVPKIEDQKSFNELKKNHLARTLDNL